MESRTALQSHCLRCGDGIIEQMINVKVPHQDYFKKKTARMREGEERQEGRKEKGKRKKMEFPLQRKTKLHTSTHLQKSHAE